MARDFFAVLGLSPGRHDPETVARSFLVERERLLAELRGADDSTVARRQLDDLHLAYATLRDPQRQAEYLHQSGGDADRVAALRTLIAASLEDGLLRHSRRQQILESARELGFNEFQAQLLIAQVQFGDQVVPPAPRVRASRARRQSRGWARVAATGLLALAMFAYLVRWVNA